MKKIYKFLKGLIFKEKPECDLDWDKLLDDNPHIHKQLKNLREGLLEFGYNAEDLI